MSIYKRGKTFWFKFKHEGQVIRESAETEDRQAAIKAERKRHAALDSGAKVKRRPRSRLQFGVAMEDWLKQKGADWSPNNLRIETSNFGHLSGHFKGTSLRDISAEGIAEYKSARKAEGASPKTIAMELGSLRALMKKHRLWADLQPDVKMPRGRDDAGRALSEDEEHRLLIQCRKNRSRSLAPAVLLALHTGLRNEELRHLRWRQVDLIEATVAVGKSKTIGGAGRVIPLSQTAKKCLQEWRSLFPAALPAHFVFCSERYGAAPDVDTGLFSHKTVPYSIDPTKAIGPWKISWTAARKAAGVDCRWHDLRHTFISRLAESQASDATIMALAGHLSRKMMERYSHVRNEAKRRAIAVLDRPQSPEGAQEGGTKHRLENGGVM
jgi:integrase